MFTTFEQLHNRYFEPPEVDILAEIGEIMRYILENVIMKLKVTMF